MRRNKEWKIEGKKGKGLAIALCLALVFSCITMGGCTDERKTEGDGGKNALEARVLRYGSSDYTAINPALYEHGEINALLFAGLTAHDEDNQVVPGLAEAWEFDKDNLTYTFRLREDLTFHDGKPLTSEDVKFTLEAILNPENGSEIISNYTDIKEILCPDQLTVEIKLKQENVAFPDYMTIGILPKHLLEGKDLSTCDFNRKPIGAGPYRFVEWDMGQSITMERFDGYYGGKAKIEKVVFVISPESDTRAIQLKAGEIDMAQITPKTAKDLERVEGLRVYRMETADYRALAYNFKHPFFKKHVELPGILSYAIDKEAIVESVLLGEGQVAYSPLQKNKYSDEGIEKYEYNPDRAIQLLSDKGWRVGDDGYFEKASERLEFTISAMAGDQARIDMALMCAEQLEKIHAKVRVEVKPALDWEEQMTCIIGWGSPFDADDHTYKVFTSNAGDNFTFYSNDKIDELLSKARHTSNEEERRRFYGDFQNQLAKEPAYTFLAYVDADYAMKSNVKGITEDTILGHHGVGVFWNIADWTIE